jgi:hypothetical protein
VSTKRSIATPILMMTCLSTARPQPDGPFDVVLRKPFTPDLLLETVAAVRQNDEGLLDGISVDWTQRHRLE